MKVLSSFPGIPPHIDTHSAFEDTILSLSLGAQVNTFQLIPNNETQTCLLSLPLWRRVCSHVSVFISDCDGFPPSWWLPGSSGVACSQSSGDEGREQIPVDSWVSLNLSCWPITFWTGAWALLCLLSGLLLGSSMWSHPVSHMATRARAAGL